MVHAGTGRRTEHTAVHRSAQGAQGAHRCAQGCTGVHRCAPVHTVFFYHTAPHVFARVCTKKHGDTDLQES